LRSGGCIIIPNDLTVRWATKPRPPLLPPNPTKLSFRLGIKTEACQFNRRVWVAVNIAVGVLVSVIVDTGTSSVIATDCAELHALIIITKTIIMAFNFFRICIHRQIFAAQRGHEIMKDYSSTRGSWLSSVGKLIFLGS
jgi:hypothetical protein